MEKPKAALQPVTNRSVAPKAQATVTAPIKILPTQPISQTPHRPEPIAEKKVLFPNTPKPASPVLGVLAAPAAKPIPSIATTISSAPAPVFGFQSSGSLSFGLSKPSNEVKETAKPAEPAKPKETSSSFGLNSGNSGFSFGETKTNLFSSTTITPIPKAEALNMTIKSSQEVNQSQKENVLPKVASMPHSAAQILSQTVKLPSSTEVTPITATSQAPLTIFGQSANASNLFAKSPMTSAPKSIAESSPAVVSLLKGTSSITVTPIASSVSTQSTAPIDATTTAPKPIIPTNVSTPTPIPPFSFSLAGTPNTNSVTEVPLSLTNKPDSTPNANSLFKDSIVNKPSQATTPTQPDKINPPASSFSFALPDSTNSKSITQIPLSATNTGDSSPSAGSLFKDFNVCKPNTVEPTGTSIFTSKAFAAAASAPTTPTTASIFGTSVSSAPKPSTPGSSIFGNAAISSPSTAEPSKPNSLFGNVAVPEAKPAVSSTGSIFGSLAISSLAASTTSSASVFGSAPTTTPAPSSGNIFGGSGAALGFGSFNISDSNQSSSNIFGSANKDQNPFAAATPSTASVFGGTANNTNSASIFGGATNTNNSGGSVFGNAATPTPGVFGSPAPNTGSVFGSPAPSSPFGQAANPQSNTPSGGSIFGGSSTFGDANKAQPQQSGGSIFSSGFGGSFAQAANAPAFGSAATFGNNSGVFGQATSPVQQTGFGSPNQNNAFGMANSNANSPPAFGQSASFGGAATFGSPKAAFGSFGNANQSFGASTPQKNTLFESLGASDSGMTFGNLAQNQNAPPAAKPFSQG